MALESFKNQIWDHYVATTDKKYLKYMSVTPKRLERVKPFVWADDYLWNDMWRHGWGTKTIEALQADEHGYEHCHSNFWLSINELMHENGIIK